MKTRNNYALSIDKNEMNSILTSIVVCRFPFSFHLMLHAVEMLHYYFFRHPVQLQFVCVSEWILCQIVLKINRSTNASFFCLFVLEIVIFIDFFFQ